MSDAEWLGIADLADELGLSVRTLYAWRTRANGLEDGPRAYRFGKHLRFRREDVDAWLEQHREEPRKTRPYEARVCPRCYQSVALRAFQGHLCISTEATP